MCPTLCWWKICGNCNSGSLKVSSKVTQAHTKNQISKAENVEIGMRYLDKYTCVYVTAGGTVIQLYCRNNIRLKNKIKLSSLVSEALISTEKHPMKKYNTAFWPSNGGGEEK